MDLFIEASTLNLIDEDEYSRILKNALGAGRVDVGTLLNYARRRKLNSKQFVEWIKSI